MATRVNKNFLIISASIIVGAVVLMVGAKLLIFNKNATTLIASGDRALANGDAQEAILWYKKAIGKEPSNLDYLIKLGDAYNSIAGESSEYLGQARGAWSSTLTLNAAYIPALERLTNSFSDQLQIQQSPDLYKQVRETATKLAKAQADKGIDNRQALAREHLAVVQPWLAGIAVLPKEVDDSVDALTKLAPRDPANADVAWTIAASKLRKASLARQHGDDASANQLIADAVAFMDASLKGQEQNVAMQARANQIFQGAAASTLDAKLKDQYTKKGDAALDAALAVVKPEDDQFFEVALSAANRAMIQKKPEEAQKILRDLLAKKPQDLNVRTRVAVELAKDPANRDEAIAILSEPVKPLPDQNKGAKAIARRFLEARTHLELANLLVEKARTSDNAVARANALAELDKQYAQAEAFFPSDNIALLHLKARRQELHGDNSGAIQTYDRAISLLQPDQLEGYEIKNEAARAYLAANQTTAAKKLLDEIAQKFDKHLPTRQLQFDIAMRENNLDEAKKLLDIMDKISPEAAAAAVPLRVQYLKKAGDPKAADEYYAKLPETNRLQRLSKAQIAGILEKNDEVVRLASVNYKADPKDLASLDMMVRGLMAAKRTDEAKKLLDDALVANPGNAAIADVRQRLDMVGASANDRYAKDRELVKSREKDPFRQAFLLGEVARRYGRIEDAAKDYAAAAAVNPKDAGLMSRRFDTALMLGKFDEAQGYLKPLTEAAGDAAPSIQARFALAKGDAASALKYARELTQSRAEFADSWVLLGQSEQALRHFGDAVNAYLQARDRQAGNFEAVKGLVECYYNLGQPADAGHIIDEGRGLFPDNALFKDMDLVYEVNYGDPEKAIADREQQYKDYPTNPMVALVLADAYQKTAFKKYASDAAKRDDFMKKAQDVLVKGAAAFPQDSRFQSSLAEVELASGDFAAGETRLKNFAAQDAMKGRPEPMLLLADYYARANKPELMEGALRDALARSNNNPQIRARLVASLADRKQYDNALKELEGQTDKIFTVQRIEILVAAGRGPEAEAAMKAAIEKSPETAVAYRSMLVNYYISQKRYPEALSQIEVTLRDDPKNENALYSRAVVRLTQTKRDANGAIDDLKRIRSIDPLNLQAASLLSDAYYAANLPDKSLSELEDIQAKAPGNPQVRRKLLDRYMQRQDYDAALRLAKEAESAAATASDPFWPLAASRASAAEGQLTDALASIQIAIRRTPQDQNLGVFREYLDLLLRAKQYKTLFDTSNQIITQGRTDWWLLADRALARSLGNKDNAGALTDFDAALVEADKSGEPDAAERVVSVMTSTVGADAALARVEPRTKTDPHWLVISALIRNSKKDAAGAMQDMDQAVAATASKETPPVLRQGVLRKAASFYYNIQPPQIAKAQAAYEELIKIQPQDFGSLNNLAVLLSEDATPPDLSRATQYAKAAYDLVSKQQPMNTHVVDTYAWLLVQNNQAKDAIRMLMDVVDAEPMLIDARYHLGEAHLQLKEPQAAQDQLRVAMDAINKLPEEQQPAFAKMKTRIGDGLVKAKAMLEAVSTNSNLGVPEAIAR